MTLFNLAAEFIGCLGVCIPFSINTSIRSRWLRCILSQHCCFARLQQVIEISDPSTVVIAEMKVVSDDELACLLEVSEPARLFQASVDDLSAIRRQSRLGKFACSDPVPRLDYENGFAALRGRTIRRIFDKSFCILF
jgi:hypothetical protein